MEIRIDPYHFQHLYNEQDISKFEAKSSDLYDLDVEIKIDNPTNNNELTWVTMTCDCIHATVTHCETCDCTHA